MKLLPIIALVTFQTVAVADDELPPADWLATSGNRRCLFKMVAPTWRQEGDRQVNDRAPSGVAYQIGEGGELQELWRTEGWYAFNGFLSDDGRYFVRFGPWPTDIKDLTDLAIAFYDRGELIKDYRVGDLIRNRGLLLQSASHYRWHPASQTEPDGFLKGAFHLVMIDKTAYDFDYTTGKILASSQDEGVKTSKELAEENHAKSSLKGMQLFEASPIHASFVDQFDISNVGTKNEQRFGCSLKGETWAATLKPKKQLKSNAEVAAIFPIVDGKRLEASVKPEYLLKVLEAALDHPSISKRIDPDEAPGITLLCLGDRLYWNTDELVRLLTKAIGTKPEEEDLAEWASLFIWSVDSRFTNIHFNTRTHEVLAEDSFKNPSEPFLLDAKGVRIHPIKAGIAPGP